jgi:hypothetical protein
MNARRPVVFVLTAGLWLVGSGTSANAQAPVRTGWWNTATVSGNALPSTTSPGNLRVSGGPSGSMAYAALSYHVPTYASATLTLHAVAGTEIGTPVVLACPTQTDTWPAGGDQPIQAAPAFDCAGRSVTAVVGSDSLGTTLTFLLDPSQQVAPGVTSLAIVPGEASTAFSLDLAVPDEHSLNVAAVSPSPAPTQEPTVRATAGSAPPRSQALPPPFTGQATPLSAQSGVAPTPSVVATVPPVILPESAASLPVSSAGPGSGTSQPVRRDAAVLLGLLAGAFAYLLVQHRSAPPQLIGGRARAMTPTEPEGPARGIGRFARVRSAPARGLR